MDESTCCGQGKTDTQLSHPSTFFIFIGTDIPEIRVLPSAAARGSTASEISEKLGIGEQANIIQSSGLCSKSGVTQNPEYDSRTSIWRKLKKPDESLRTFLQL